MPTSSLLLSRISSSTPHLTIVLNLDEQEATAFAGLGLFLIFYGATQISFPGVFSRRAGIVAGIIFAMYATAGLVERGLKLLDVAAPLLLVARFGEGIMFGRGVRVS